MNSTLVILAVTLERYLAICWPLKSATWRTASRAKVTIPAIFVFSIVYNIPYLKTSALPQGLLCAAIARHDTGSKVWAWFGFFLNFITPFCLLVTLNTFIVRAIHGRAKYLDQDHVRMKRTFKRSSTRNSIFTPGKNVRRSNTISSRISSGSENSAQDQKPAFRHSISEGQLNRQKSNWTAQGRRPKESNKKVRGRGDKSAETAENGTPLQTISGEHDHKPLSEDHTTVFSAMLNADESDKGSSDTSVNHSSTTRNGGDMENKHQRQLTVMLLVVTTIFLLLTSPQYVRYIIFSFLDITRDQGTFASAVLLYHLTNKLFYTNSAVNFFLYCIAGSKFRSDVRLLWQRHFTKSDNVTVTYKSSTSE